MKERIRLQVDVTPELYQKVQEIIKVSNGNERHALLWILTEGSDTILRSVDKRQTLVMAITMLGKTRARGEPNTARRWACSVFEPKEVNGQWRWRHICNHDAELSSNGSMPRQMPEKADYLATVWDMPLLPINSIQDGAVLTAEQLKAVFGQDRTFDPHTYDPLDDRG